MASAITDSMPGAHVSDEEWLVHRARGCLRSDVYAAKAWLLTARTLYPRNFAIQVSFAILSTLNPLIWMLYAIPYTILEGFPRVLHAHLIMNYSFFKNQFEAYIIEKNSKNLKEVAVILEEM